MTQSIDAAVTAGPPATARGLATWLNRVCLCESFDSLRLKQLLEGDAESAETAGISYAGLRRTHPFLFSDSVVYVTQDDLAFMARLVEVVERVVALPEWRARVLAYAPESARYRPPAAGAFLGYDFHLGSGEPKLIEINTNAGGGLLQAKLLRAQRTACEHSPRHFAGLDVEAEFVEMFREEWRLSRGDAPLRRIAVVDESPADQFLLPEFLLFKRLFLAAGIDALIADPRELTLKDGKLWAGSLEIDLVYNRLTDFSLDEALNGTLRDAWLRDAVVLTPHPHAHAIYADKRNLIVLSDGEWLRSIGVGEEDLAVLAAGVPRAELVTPARAEEFWASRRRWFFKPAAGYGGKAAYRGDKLTKRVFGEISRGGYIAQALVPPSERQIRVDGVERSLKFDVRNFAYRQRVQMVSARLYQGQTTNFRTHGGGFAPVLAVPASP